MAVNSVMGNFRGHGRPHVHAHGKNQAHGKNHAHNQKNVKEPDEKKTGDTITIEKPEQCINEKTMAYLETLREKFGNVNFIIGQKGDPNLPKGSNGKEYNCYISFDLLKQMASDDKVAEKYENIITGAKEQLGNLKQQVEEKGLQRFVSSYNAKVNDNGEVEYSVGLRNGFNSFHSFHGFHGFHNHGRPLPQIKADNIDEIVKKIDDYANGRMSPEDYKSWAKNLKPHHSFHHSNMPSAFKLPFGIAQTKQLMMRQMMMARPVILMPVQILRPVFMHPPMSHGFHGHHGHNHNIPSLDLFA